MTNGYGMMNKRGLTAALVAAALKNDNTAILAISEELAKRGATHKLSVVKDEKAKVFAAIESDWQGAVDSFEDLPISTLEATLSLDGGPTADNPAGISKQTRVASHERKDGFRVVVLVERVMSKDDEGRTTDSPINTNTAWNRPESDDSDEESVEVQTA